MMFMPVLWNDNDTTANYEDIFNSFDNMMDKFWGNSLEPVCAMRTDISEEDKDYRLECELPGFDKKDIKLDLKDGVLKIEASHNSDDDKKDKNGKLLRRERTSSSYCRSFTVPENVKTDEISAKYDKGILTILIPKKEEPKLETSSDIQIQ